MSTPAILALLATVALGVVAGLRFLMRARSRVVVRAHLLAALLALGLVAAATLTGPAGGGLALGMLATAIAAGWSARRVARRSNGGAKLLLIGHVFGGVAAALVFLAWSRLS
jgi:hypothetical protein